MVEHLGLHGFVNGIDTRIMKDVWTAMRSEAEVYVIREI